jgi:hypothetical protein
MERRNELFAEPSKFVPETAFRSLPRTITWYIAPESSIRIGRAIRSSCLLAI